MIRVCAWCSPQHEYGQTEPLDNKSVTHGMCEKAAAIENAKLDALFGEAVVPPSPLFFCRAYCGNTTDS